MAAQEVYRLPELGWLLAPERGQRGISPVVEADLDWGSLGQGDDEAGAWPGALVADRLPAKVPVTRLWTMYMPRPDPPWPSLVVHRTGRRCAPAPRTHALAIVADVQLHMVALQGPWPRCAHRPVTPSGNALGQALSTRLMTTCSGAPG